MRRVFKWKNRFAVCLLLGLLMGTSCTCEGTGQCTGEAGASSTDTNGLACQQRCECNNQAYEGYCVAGKCIAFARQSCTLIGSRIPCRLSVQVDQQKSCEWGERTCKPDYLTNSLWGDCTPYEVVKDEGSDPAKAAEQCSNGKDDDCDGLIDNADDGCNAYCKQPGERRPCYDVPEAQREVLNQGRCAPGLQLCTQERRWGECAAQVTPTEETCNGVDDDCDGNIDENVANCKATICKDGEKQLCFTNAAGCRREADGTFTCKGTCKAGFRTCQGGQFGSCEQQNIPAVEKCGDGLDNNCNGQTDEGCLCEEGKTQECYSGPEDTKGKGACLAGIQSCKDGQWSECRGEQGPTPERCNGLDDDCNGQIDEGCGSCRNGDVQACAVATTQENRNKGACRDGFQVCFAGTWSRCTGEFGPKDEICDGVDNDCNGLIDDNCKSCVTGTSRSCYSGPANTQGKGACRAGIQLCIYDDTTKTYNFGPCQGEVTPTADDSLCDGVDNNCNGQIDEDCKQECTPGYARACPEGPEPSAPCRKGIQVCIFDPNTQKHIFGPCQGEIKASPEICNGLDDDCNGQIDDNCSKCVPGYSRSCYTGAANTEGKGTCKGGIQLCVYDAQTQTYDFGPCQGEIKPRPEICDGQDDDCDGQIDNACSECVIGATQTCYTSAANTKGIGPCKEGLQICGYNAQTKKNVFGACFGEVKPTTSEVCGDNVDNNCNGQVDENCGCNLGDTRTCYTGPSGTQNIGNCRDGVQACRYSPTIKKNEWGSCVGQTLPAAEGPCDGLDNNCDGQIDEGCTGCILGYARQCYTGPASTLGKGICKAGIETCVIENGIAQFSKCIGQETPNKNGETCNGLDEDCNGQIDDNTCASGYICVAVTKEDGTPSGTCLLDCTGSNSICTNESLCRNATTTQQQWRKACGFCQDSSQCAGKTCIDNVCR